MFDDGLDHAQRIDDVRFENSGWRVLDDGLEHRGTGYFIARDVLAMRRRGDLWEWPLQLSEKSWCALRPFREAFLNALDAFGIERDAFLAYSFAVGFGTRAQNGSTGPDFVTLGALVQPRAFAGQPMPVGTASTRGVRTRISAGA